MSVCTALAQDSIDEFYSEKMIKVAGMASAVTKDYVKQICDATR